MSEKRFTFGAVSPNVAMIKDNGEPMNIGEVVDKLNEQQDTINILLEELVNAQQQGYVVNFLHKNEYCSLM